MLKRKIKNVDILVISSSVLYNYFDVLTKWFSNLCLYVCRWILDIWTNHFIDVIAWKDIFNFLIKLCVEISFTYWSFNLILYLISLFYSEKKCYDIKGIGVTVSSRTFNKRACTYRLMKIALSNCSQQLADHAHSFHRVECLRHSNYLPVITYGTWRSLTANVNEKSDAGRYTRDTLPTSESEVSM